MLMWNSSTLWHQPMTQMAIKSPLLPMVDAEAAVAHANLAAGKDIRPAIISEGSSFPSWDQQADPHPAQDLFLTRSTSSWLLLKSKSYGSLEMPVREPDQPDVTVTAMHLLHQFWPVPLALESARWKTLSSSMTSHLMIWNGSDVGIVTTLLLAVKFGPLPMTDIPSLMTQQVERPSICTAPWPRSMWPLRLLD